MSLDPPSWRRPKIRLLPQHQPIDQYAVREVVFDADLRFSFQIIWDLNYGMDALYYATRSKAP